MGHFDPPRGVEMPNSEKFTRPAPSGVFEPPMVQWKPLGVHFPKTKKMTVTKSIFRFPALRPEVQGGGSKTKADFFEILNSEKFTRNI